ncbi:hypothetical protein ACH5RR_017921 [Cinchona calisaya]|uniref:Uncharacterized protein n=1 Tax=Cinchona calisaya TaxID=153742 RepID=A0ABD2ZMV9_9GENT
MASSPPKSAKALVLMQLSLLLLMGSSVVADEVELVSWPAHPPAEAPKPHHSPSHPPVHPPVNPPAHPPVKPPVHHPVDPPVVRKLVAVQGVVYCKSCKYAGVDTLWGAKPLVGAVVRLICHNTQYKPVVAEAMTDKNGYFLIMPEKLTNAAHHKCKVFLVKSPSEMCNVPTNFNYGLNGTILVPTSKPNPLGPKYALFNVGPFAYEPSKKIPCPL